MYHSLIDLHIHSSVSDGSLSPAEIVKYASKIGLAAISITDHDTIDGIGEAMREAEQYKMEIVPGVEISAQYKNAVPHLLGYYIDIENHELNEALKWTIEARDERNPQIIKRLNEIGIDINMDEVLQIAGGGVVGRPHIAGALVRSGAVKNHDEAFDLYLGARGSAYIPKARMPMAKAISIIRDSKGIPVLAHPMTLTRNNLDLDDLLREWITMGLEGIEVWYSEHTEDETELYIKLAEKYDLVKTGGSDFHGVAKTGIDMGSGKGNLEISIEVLNALKERLHSI
ncbi:MAG: PHP domain-containing protein [Candidatus Electryonea clarkiae]|nr:PHP domain-containing protein [Candidatus Electryonea clarkiae]MDP8285396.1 PHP domain-containing protein [Candidatus Electryonea clarkiae]